MGFNGNKYGSHILSWTDWMIGMQRFRFHSNIAWRFVFTLDPNEVLVSQRICCLSILSHSIGKLSTVMTGLTGRTDIWPVMSDLYHYYAIRTVVTGQYSNVTGIPFLHYVSLAIGHIPPISQVFKFVCCDSYWLEYIISLLWTVVKGIQCFCFNVQHDLNLDVHHG